MIEANPIFTYVLGLLVIASPIALLFCLGFSVFFGLKLSEVQISRLTQIAVVLGLVPAIAILIIMLLSGSRFIPIEVGHWVLLEQEDFHFHFLFIFDRLSVPFTILSFILCGVVGTFTRRYLHREDGYLRFFVLYSIFFAGMVLSSLAGTIETLFLGWEMVGLSSALLVAYFHENKSPVQNGFRVWVIYRVADATFLLAALFTHHLAGFGDFVGLFNLGQWPEGSTNLSSSQALLVGLLILISAMGKSAIFPFSSWLPRAMEGPTPSSAVFYGSLSVHLGAYLLLRMSPIIDASTSLQITIVVIGIISAIFASLMAQVQSDTKSALAFASVTQVSIIFVEIGLGLRYLALIHILGHASLRTLQLLRAPSLLRDHQSIRDAVGEDIVPKKSAWIDSLSPKTREALYRFSYERGYTETILNSYIVSPFLRFFKWASTTEKHLLMFISSKSTPNEKLHKSNMGTKR